MTNQHRVIVGRACWVMPLVALLGLAAVAPAQVQTNCFPQPKVQDQNSVGAQLSVDVTGTNLDIGGMKITRTWVGGGSRTEIRGDAPNGCDCNEPGLTGLLTSPFSVINNVTTISELAQAQTLVAGDIAGFSSSLIEIPAVSGVELVADWVGETASLDYYSRGFNRANSWSYVDCVSSQEDWQGGRGKACQKAIETTEFKVKKLVAFQSYNVNVSWTFSNQVDSDYAFTPYAGGVFCAGLGFVGTPSNAAQRHFIRLTIKGLDVNGNVLVTKSVSGVASTNHGAISRSGFYNGPDVFYSTLNQNGQCAPGKPYDGLSSDLAVPNGTCDYPQPFCSSYVIPGLNLSKVLVIREFDLMCLQADIDFSGVIDLSDRNTLSGLIGVSIGPDGSGNYDEHYNPRADTDLDGTIDMDDLDQFDDENCTADTNGDGTLDIFDSQLFVNWFNAHDPRADLDADGQFTIFDTQEYNNLFSAGCP